MMQTEFAFSLPIGFVDQDGTVHKDGVMRMATAMDEIAPLRDLRVRSNQAYLAIILLSRVVTQLGHIAGGLHRGDRKPVRSRPGLSANALPPRQ